MIAYIELYDVTNDRVIPNTTLSTNATDYELKSTSVNFLKDMPKTTITLNFRVRTDKVSTDPTISLPTAYLPVLKIFKK